MRHTIVFGIILICISCSNVNRQEQLVESCLVNLFFTYNGEPADNKICFESRVTELGAMQKTCSLDAASSQKNFRDMTYIAGKCPSGEIAICDLSAVEKNSRYYYHNPTGDEMSGAEMDCSRDGGVFSLDSAKPDSAYRVINYQTKGNLEAPNPAECAEVKKLSNEQNPSDIFQGMRKCIDSEEHSLAAEMYFAAMTYGYYDTQRVSDKTAHQGIIVLRISTLRGLPEESLKKLRSEIDLVMKDNSRLCESLSTRGLPNYYPRYMIQHGMGAFTGERANSGLIENFDSESAWSSAIEKVVQCKKANKH